MSQRDISSLVSELDTDLTWEISTSLATDLSLSDETEDRVGKGRQQRTKPRRSTAEDQRGLSGKITRQLIERKQLLHDLQLVKIELSQKTLIIDNLKAESLTRIEELEERLAEASHTKQILQAKLEAQLNLHKEEAKHRQQKLQSDLEAIGEKQHRLEATNAELQRKVRDARRVLHDLELSEEQYSALKGLKEEELTLRDIIAIKFYEEKRPLELKLLDLDGFKETLELDLRRTKEEQARLLEAFEKEQKLKRDLEVNCQRLTLEVANLKSAQNQDDYRRENYDRVKNERDSIERELDDARTQHTYLNVTYKAVAEERDALAKELGDRKQELLLLQQDKGYLSKQHGDTSNKLAHAEERLAEALASVDRAKKSREDLYEKYIESRDRYKSEYENKLRDELESIRLRTEAEIDKLKSTMRDTFERENRSLRESRDNALLEKERVLASEKEVKSKYEELFTKYRELQASSDARLSELSGEVRLKSFEAERSGMIQEETLQSLKQAQVDSDKLQKKIEVVTKEYYALQSTSERRAAELEAQVSELRTKLDTYERLEKELDDVVMQAAEYDDAEEAKKVLFSYGYGANVPSTAKRRLQHSVHLARRVLELERQNTSLKKEIGQGETKIQQLCEELSSATNLLEQSQQPYNYLIDSIKTRDRQISSQRDHIAAATEDLRRLKEEREKLIREKNQMAADLERLLSQREQMAVIKQMVLGLSHQSGGITTSNPVVREKLTASALVGPPLSREAGDDRVDQSAGQPQPTVFTQGETSQWYERMQQANARRSRSHRKSWTDKM
ncbi:progesterone-induced-blocking factor 1-like [Diadema antillarum]|uniref:progesterone-induced-blocking factor 1-like n=1 Tax=Diadema antillarum TaxID=105358 RepID=UPI003A88A498